MIRLFLHLTILVVGLFPLYGIAQTEIPIAEWKTKLSLKNDIGFLKLKEVDSAISALDSTRRCEVLNLLQQAASNGNTRLQIRTALLWVWETYNFLSCQDSIPDRKRLEQALRQCYEISDQQLAIIVHLTVAAVHLRHDELGLAITHELAAKDGMEKAGLSNFQNYSIVLYASGELLYRSKDYRSSAKLTEQSLQYYGSDEFNKKDSLDPNMRMNAWNNLGLCYKQLMLYDSAMYAFNQASLLTKEPFWLALLKGNRGDVFYLQGKYDSAEALLRIDYAQSLEYGELGNAAVTMERLARIMSAHGDPGKALSMIRTAETLERKSSNKEIKASIWHSYAVIFKDLGNADSALAYMEKYKDLSDIISKISADNKVEIAQLQLANEENKNEIDLLQKEKTRIKLIRNFSISLILALAAFGYVYLNRMRLQSKLKQQEATEARRKAEMETVLAKEQLNIFTESLREKTQQMEELQSRSLEKEQHREQMGQMQELTTYTILTDDDWERFKNLFIKVYPGFFIELIQYVPDITLAEQRMAALIKLHVPNKYAAAMLGISHNSIYKTRQRLRQRLGIEKDEEMDVFFREGPK